VGIVLAYELRKAHTPKMNEDEQQPPSDEQGGDRRRVNPALLRNMAIVFVIIAVGFGFGRPLAAGYYFGGCDNAEDSQHYVLHVFGVEMCRDITLTSPAERSAAREEEGTSLTELTEGESASPEAGAPAPGTDEPAHS